MIQAINTCENVPLQLSANHGDLATTMFRKKYQKKKGVVLRRPYIARGRVTKQTLMGEGKKKNKHTKAAATTTTKATTQEDNC